MTFTVLFTTVQLPKHCKMSQNTSFLLSCPSIKLIIYYPLNTDYKLIIIGSSYPLTLCLHDS